VPINNQDDEFVQLLTKHQSSLKAYIISRMPGLSGVNDALQETNLTLWKKRANFNPGTNFTAWTFAVARFTILEHRRKLRSSDPLVFSDELTESLAYSPEDLTPEKTEARHEALRACLDRLSEKHRDLIHLRYHSKESLEDFARDHGKSAASLRVTLHHIRTNLRNCINFQLRHSDSPQ
jgi:RNA polymerase sigma-70 factor, ECF subfamily